MASALDLFATQAHEFCRWATGEDGTPVTPDAALRQVAALYRAALDLPDPFADATEDDSPDTEASADLLARVGERAARLPLQTYWEVFDPVASPPDEPSLGLSADDLADIYLDVARGLRLFEAGERAAALWEWGFNFRIHWGAHATSLMRALHAWLAQEAPGGLSRSG